MTSTCWARVGELEFGPFPLAEFVQLVNRHSLPSDLEFRIERTELWWSLLSIQAGAPSLPDADRSCLEDWFVRTQDHIAGPYTVVDVTEDLLAGRLSPEIDIQIGDGPWSPVAELLVLITEPPTPVTESPLPAISELDSAAASTESPLPEPAPLSPEETRKAQLEAWFAETLPERKITVTVVPRTSTGTLDDIIASAMLRMSAEAKEAARELSRPWIWGGLTAISMVSILFLLWPHRGPDELEITAYYRLMAASEAIRAVRATQPSEKDWKAFAEELTGELKSLKEDLSLQKRANTPAKELLFWAIEYRLPRILQEGRLKPSPAETHFAENLRQAKKHLGTAAR